MMPPDDRVITRFDCTVYFVHQCTTKMVRCVKKSPTNVQCRVRLLNFKTKALRRLWFNVISVMVGWMGVKFPEKRITQHLNGPFLHESFMTQVMYLKCVRVTSD